MIFVTNPAIRRINRKFLGHDRFTDVIAFGYGRDILNGKTACCRRAAEQPFGDIYISIDQARRQARELRHSLLEELVTLAVHGALHLKGYTDQKSADRKRMSERQDRIVRRLLTKERRGQGNAIGRRVI